MPGFCKRETYEADLESSSHLLQLTMLIDADHNSSVFLRIPTYFYHFSSSFTKQQEKQELNRHCLNAKYMSRVLRKRVCLTKDGLANL